MEDEQILAELVKISSKNSESIDKITQLLANISTTSKTNVQKFTPFIEGEETFDSYIDRLELYFRVQNIAETSKVDSFVSLLPPKLFESLKNRCIQKCIVVKIIQNLFRYFATLSTQNL